MTPETRRLNDIIKTQAQELETLKARFATQTHNLDVVNGDWIRISEELETLKRRVGEAESVLFEYGTDIHVNNFFDYFTGSKLVALVEKMEGE